MTLEEQIAQLNDKLDCFFNLCLSSNALKVPEAGEDLIAREFEIAVQEELAGKARPMTRFLAKSENRAWLVSLSSAQNSP